MKTPAWYTESMLMARQAGQFFIWLLGGSIFAGMVRLSVQLWWGLSPLSSVVLPLLWALAIAVPCLCGLGYGYISSRRKRLPPGVAAQVGIAGMGLHALIDLGAAGLPFVTGEAGTRQLSSVVDGWGLPPFSLARVLLQVVAAGASCALGAYWQSLRRRRASL